MFREISVKFWSVSESSVSRKFGKSRTRRNSIFLGNFRFLNCLSQFKSIINKNQQNYTYLKGLLANCSKLHPNLLWSFEKFVDRNCLKRLKFREIVCLWNFRNYANFAKFFTEIDRNVLRNFTKFRWFRNFGANLKSNQAHGF